MGEVDTAVEGEGCPGEIVGFDGGIVAQGGVPFPPTQKTVGVIMEGCVAAPPVISVVKKSLKSVVVAAPPRSGERPKISSTVFSVELWS